jgi:two-component system phosphate regulon sensor histidine kinase PhoR
MWRNGLLPEALSLGFVVFAFVGLAAAYLVCDRGWRGQARSVEQSATETLARTWAALLASRGDADQAPGELLGECVRGVPYLRRVQWTAPDGSIAFEWPRPLALVVGLAERPASGTSATGPAPLVATAAVSAPGGANLGLLTVEREMPAADGRTFLLITWGAAAGFVLFAFAVFHQRLRRHLRPAAAIEHSLTSYAAGIEKELLTLTLSDSLGAAARGWNQLIEQLAAMQREQETGRAGDATGNVLARFENAVFRRVLDRLPFGVLCITPEQRVSYANGAAATLLGRSLNEMVHRPVSMAIHNPAVQQGIAGVQAGSGSGMSVDQSTGQGDQETTLRFRVLPAPAPPAGGDAVVTVEDISQLRESQRARDNFLYHVTHELRTPLTNIHAYAETLTQPGFDDEQTRKECYNVLISETRRLSRLVEDILSISQLEVGTARLDVGEVELARLVRQMVQDSLGTADEKKIDLTLSLPPKLPKIKGDKQRLSVLLNNLIGNAVKYTPENGKVHVSVELEGQRILISVRDTGIGIAPEAQPHVFEKFYRAADDAVQMLPGTGLGLALARELARLHGGDILLESERGKGSTFTVELPNSAAAAAEVPER